MFCSFKSREAVYLCTGPRQTSPHSRSLHHTSTTSGCSVHFYTRTGSTWSSLAPRWERLRGTASVRHHFLRPNGATVSSCLFNICSHVIPLGFSYEDSSHHSWPHLSSPHSRPYRHTSTPGSHTLRWHTGRCKRHTLC